MDSRRRDNWLSAINDLSDRWGISTEAAELYLERVGYSPPPHNPNNL